MSGPVETIGGALPQLNLSSVSQLDIPSSASTNDSSSSPQTPSSPNPRPFSALSPQHNPSPNPLNCSRCHALSPPSPPNASNPSPRPMNESKDLGGVDASELSESGGQLSQIVAHVKAETVIDLAIRVLQDSLLVIAAASLFYVGVSHLILRGPIYRTSVSKQQGPGDPNWANYCFYEPDCPYYTADGQIPYRVYQALAWIGQSLACWLCVFVLAKFDARTRYCMGGILIITCTAHAARIFAASKWPTSPLAMNESTVGWTTMCFGWVASALAVTMLGAFQGAGGCILISGIFGGMVFGMTHILHYDIPHYQTAILRIALTAVVMPCIFRAVKGTVSRMSHSCFQSENVTVFLIQFRHRVAVPGRVLQVNTLGVGWSLLCESLAVIIELYQLYKFIQIREDVQKHAHRDFRGDNTSFQERGSFSQTGDPDVLIQTKIKECDRTLKEGDSASNIEDIRIDALELGTSRDKAKVGVSPPKLYRVGSKADSQTFSRRSSGTSGASQPLVELVSSTLGRKAERDPTRTTTVMALSIVESMVTEAAYTVLCFVLPFIFNYDQDMYTLIINSAVSFAGEVIISDSLVLYILWKKYPDLFLAMRQLYLDQRNWLYVVANVVAAWNTVPLVFNFYLTKCARPVWGPDGPNTNSTAVDLQLFDCPANWTAS